MQLTGQVGPNGPIASGAGSVPIRQGNLGEMIVTELNGKYYEQNFRGNLYVCTNSAAQALSLTGTTTYTGMIVYNPAGSGKNLVIQEAIFAPTAAETGVGAVMLFSQAVAATIPTLTTTNVASMPISGIVGNASSSVAKCASGCTLAANPVFLRPLVGMQYGTAVGLNMITCKDDIAGGLIIPQGAAVGFCAITTAITGLSYLSWVEVNAAVV
jgi:hypothetical protein